MAQPASNPKIEELRFRVKTDPKSRLFYPLAEELRRINRFDEAEQVLRAGLTHHASYLSAWVSLGRVLREQDKHRDAVEALTKALQIDPLYANAHYNLGVVLVQQGQFEDAIAHFRRTLELNPAAGKAMADAGHEVASHGWRWIQYRDFTLEQELDHIKKAVKVIKETAGKVITTIITPQPGGRQGCERKGPAEERGHRRCGADACRARDQSV